MHPRRTARARLALLTLVLALCFGSVPPPTASAQSTDGRLIVTVKDTSGAVIPGANITVRSEETQIETSGTTTDTGVFTLPQLKVGLYTVTVSAPNFQTTIAESVKIDLGKEYGLDLVLNPGGTSESVTVTAGEELVTTTGAEITNTVTAQQIKELPLDGRDPLQLIQLQAGVTLDNGRGGVTINGQRTASATITQDGITIQDYAIRENALTFSPNRTVVSQVAEFTVTTQNGSADLGGASSIRLVTPSGTNDLHGEIYEYHRNDAFGANSFFNNANDIERQQLIRNQFGFAVGGPVYIPKLYNGRDKFFFFGSYEGFRERTAFSATGTVFTPLARQGIFTYRRGGTGPLETVNILRAAEQRVDPIIANLLQSVPLPNSNLAGDGLNTAGYTFNKLAPTNRNQGIGRLDYNLSDRHQFEAVYQYTGEINRRPDADGTFAVLPKVFSQTETHFAVTAWTWAITDSITNELRVGLNNSTGGFVNEEDTSLGYFVVFPFTTDPQTAFDPQQRRTIVSSLIDNASWVKGSHFFRFGTRIDAVRLRNRLSFSLTPRVSLDANARTPSALRLTSGDFPAGGITQTDLGIANDLLASLAGYVGNVTREYNVTADDNTRFQSAPLLRNYKLNQYAFYFADQWRVRPGLTLNLGVRWDYTAPLVESNNLGLLPTNNVGRASLLDPGGEFDFVDGFFFEPDRNNFGPNLGVAWDVFGDGKTVVRGGFSVAYINDETIRSVQILTETNPGLTTTLDTGTIFGGTLSNGLQDVINNDLAPPDVEIPITFAQGLALNPQGFTLGINPKLKTPRYHQWNFSIEREIGWDTAIALRYVGNKGYDLLSNINVNQIDVLSNGFAADVARAQSNGFLAEARTGRFDPRYNADIPGSQQLTVFPTIESNGFITDPAIQGVIAQGQAALLADFYFRLGLRGSDIFLPNTNVYFAGYLDNWFTSDYHAFEVEARRRFSKGLAFQANYTFSKALAYSSGVDQLRQDFPVDINAINIDRRRALFDTPHNLKANVLYELPFGPGKMWDPENAVLDKLVGGWEVTSIFNWFSGSPISILANRATVTTVGSTANTNLTADQIEDLFGLFERDGKLYYINPDVIGPDGRGVAPDGQAPFAGQVFFNPGPGQYGQLQGLMFSGPSVFNWDASIIKRISLTETTNLELRGEFFNVLNRPIFGFDRSFDINATNFGQITRTQNTPRVVQVAAKITF
jgi:hypothetical protein